MSLPNLLAAARLALSGVAGGPAGDVARELLEATRGDLPVVPVAASDSAARRHLAGLSGNALGPEVAGLDWHYGYAIRLGLARDVAFANIAGPKGPLVTTSVRLGLTLIGPEILYPEHHHPAVELYVVLNGTADWSAGGGAFVPRGPGAAILHPSGIRHATRTGPETLLALFGWTGAIEARSMFT